MRTHRAKTAPGRAGALRDVLVLVPVGVVLFAVAHFLNADEVIGRWLLSSSERNGVLVVALVSLIVVSSAFALLSARGASREMNARRSAEGRLVESERSHRSLVDLSPDAVLVHSEGRFVFANAAAARLLGAETASELIGLGVLDIVHPDFREVVRERVRTAIERGEPTPLLDERFVRLDGQAVDVEVAGMPITYEGKPARQIVVRDITLRKAAEAKLIDAETRYRALIEQIPAVTYRDAVTEENPRDLVPIYISPQIEALVGVTPDEWVADDSIWEKVVHPDDLERISALGDEKFVAGEPFEAEYRMVSKDGRTVWVREGAVLVRDEQGRPKYWQGAYFDITEQRLAEDRLRQTQERYRALVENMAAVAYSWDVSDPSGPEKRYVSPQIQTLLGISPQEWMGDPEKWAHHIYPDDVETAKEGWGVLERGEADASDGEYRLVASDGRVVWVRDQTVVMERDGSGRPMKWQGVFFDITERKRAEEQLREAEARYRVLVEQLPAVVYMDAVDDVSTALYISPQYENLLGYTAQERVSDPGMWLRLLHPDDRDHVVEESDRTNRTGDPFRLEYRLIAKDGREVWVRDEATLLRDERGNPMFWQGVLLDITERKQAEQGLRRRDTILEAVSFAAERFLRTTSWEEDIEEVLERLGRAAGVSRACLFQNHVGESGDLLTSVRYEWVADGVRSRVADSFNQNYPWSPVFGRWAQVLESGGVIHGAASSFPEGERMELNADDALSLAVVPVAVGEEWWGYIGLDDCLAPRDWSPSELEALRAAASTLGAAIGRRQAEQHVLEAEEKYRNLVEQVPAVIYITHPGGAGHPLYTSPQVKDLLGFTREEWESTPGMWRRQIHPEDRERVLAEDARTDETGEPFHIEYRLLAKDGHTVWVRDDAVLLRDADGEPRFWQGVRLGITERKQAEEQLREAEEKYRNLVERTPAIVYSAIFGEGAPWLYVSPQVESILGYSPQQWMDDPRLWLERIHDDDRERVMAEEFEARDTLQPLLSEYRLLAKDGHVVWVRDEAEVVMNERGEPTLLSGLMLDITERKVAEQQLSETEAKYRALVEQIPAVLYIDRVDEDMTPVYVSPQIERMLGLSPEEYLADPLLWEKHLHPDDRERAIAESLRGTASGGPFSVEYRIVTPDRRIVWVRDESVVLANEGRGPNLVQGVMFDITERKLAEQALQESERREREAAERLRALDEMKNTFLAAVSHELRSPLTSVLGLALTLERHNLTREDETDLLARLSSNARKLDGLLRDLLDIDRLNRGIVSPQFRPMDLGALVRRTVESMDLMADRSILIETDPIVVPVDPPKVERIVENLVANAARHTADDAGIWVRVLTSEEGALITVEDDGPGVPEEIRTEIFEPFRQGPTASPHAPGTGIGLSLVARFAELHGGRAWVEEREGGGASFRVFLPDHLPEETRGDQNGSPAVRASTDRLAEDATNQPQPPRPTPVSPDRRDGPGLRAV